MIPLGHSLPIQLSPYQDLPIINHIANLRKRYKTLKTIIGTVKLDVHSTVVLTLIWDICWSHYASNLFHGL